MGFSLVRPRHEDRESSKAGVCSWLSIACWFLTPRKPSGDTFQNMIFSNECSISLQSHSRRCFRMADKPTKRKPKPKHPLNVHVWGGNQKTWCHQVLHLWWHHGCWSLRNVLETTLVPFIRNELPEHQFMQDSDPTHTSMWVQAVLWWSIYVKQNEKGKKEREKDSSYV